MSEKPNPQASDGWFAIAVRNDKQFDWDKVKRARASVKGIYGDDSTEYEMLGGTRLSERKTARRKVSKTE